MEAKFKGVCVSVCVRGQETVRLDEFPDVQSKKGRLRYEFLYSKVY